MTTSRASWPMASSCARRTSRRFGIRREWDGRPAGVACGGQGTQRLMLLNLRDDPLRIARIYDLFATIDEQVEILHDDGPDQGGRPVGFEGCPKSTGASEEFQFD